MAGDQDDEKDPAEGQAPSEAEPSESTNDESTEDVPSRDEGEKASPAPRHEGAAWARPFVRIERALTWFESRLLFVVLLALVFALVAWISLRGLASPVQSDNAAGTVFRALLGATVLGALARFGTARAKIDDET